MANKTRADGDVSQPCLKETMSLNILDEKTEIFFSFSHSQGNDPNVNPLMQRVKTLKFKNQFSFGQNLVKKIQYLQSGISLISKYDLYIKD